MASLDDLIKEYPSAFGGSAASPTGASAKSAPAHVQSFVDQFRPHAEAVGQKLGVSPDLILGQLALETGWGKSIIPGTNNLGNIKDFSGAGIAATDNMNGSRDKYKVFDSPGDFFDSYSSLLERKYKGAIGVGDDVGRFGDGLMAGGYAEDKNYKEKLANTVAMLRGQQPITTGKRTSTASRARLPQPGDFLTDSFETLKQEERQAVSDESPFSTNLKRGWQNMTDSVGNYLSVLDGDEGAVIQRMQEYAEFDKENPQPSDTRKFNEDWRNENHLSAFMNVSGLAGGITEQISNSLPAMVGSIPGMLIGAKAGAIFGPWGSAAGGAFGAFAGSAPGSIALETGGRIAEMAQRDGVDFSDTSAFNEWLRTNRDKILEEGTKKGLTVAAFDGVTGGIGSAIVMKPMIAFSQAEARVMGRLGVNMSDSVAVAAARSTPEYVAAIQPFRAALDVAGKASEKAMQGFSSFAAETAGEIGGEYYGEVAATGEGNWNEALLEGVMSAGQSSATTAAQFLGGKMFSPKPNSPLQNAANIAAEHNAQAGGDTQQAVSAQQVAPEQQGLPLSGLDVGVATPQDQAITDLSRRIADVQSLVEDRSFLQEVRNSPNFGGESVNDLLSAYAIARNPDMDVRLRESAVASIEGFIRTFSNNPNFTMGSHDSASGTAIAPREPDVTAPVTFSGDTGGRGPADSGRVFDGEVIREPVAMQDPPPALKAFDVASLVKQGWAPAEKAREMVSPDGTETRPLNAVQYAVAREAFRRVQAGRAQGVSADGALGAYKQFELNRARYQEEQVQVPEPSMADLYHAGYYEEGSNEGGLSTQGEEVLSSFHDAVDADYWGFDVRDILRVLGFTEEEINENTRGSGSILQGAEGEAGFVAGGRTEYRRAEDAGDGSGERSEEDGAGGTPQDIAGAESRVSEAPHASIEPGVADVERTTMMDQYLDGTGEVQFSNAAHEVFDAWESVVGKEMSEAESMRSLGFTEEEISELSNGTGIEGQDGSPSERGAGEGQGEDQGRFALEGHTEEDAGGKSLRVEDSLTNTDAGQEGNSFGSPPGPQKVQDSLVSAEGNDTKEPSVSGEPQKTEGRVRIDDFGEKIGGAKKDVWGEFRERMERAGESDLLVAPLSESWPAPNYQTLIDNGADPFAVAFMRACRDEIPSKPRMKHKVRRWAEKVSLLREVSMGLVNGTIDSITAKNLLSKAAGVSRGMQDIEGRIDLYLAVGHHQSLSEISLTSGNYSFYKGVKYNPSKAMWVVSKETSSTWPEDLVSGDSREEAIQNFKSRYDEFVAKPPVKKNTIFDIFSKVGENGFFVGKKIGRNPALFAGPFKTLSEARLYKDQNAEALLEKLEKFKEVPAPRRDTNNPRVGEDMREGLDVTPELFSDTFGFRGVEFGNWVEQKKRQEDLNNTYDALMDMAAILEIPPKAISLNGELSIAFGARGNGGARAFSAHYEDIKVVVNLTKKKGAGSLGHEWWHALDNYFSRMGGYRSDYMTERGVEKVISSVRKEMVSAFESLKHTIHATSIKARSSKLDAKRTQAYWMLGKEMSARAFESYLISKLQDQNASNDYLANIADEDTWKAAEALGFELDGSYPYPTAGEIPKIRGAFDHFFQTIETRETDRGVALFRSDPSDSDDSKEAFSRAEADGFVEQFLKSFPGAPEIVVTNSFSQLPEHVQQDAHDQGGSSYSTKGAFFDGRVYVVAGNHHTLADFEATVFHEVMGHAGVRQLFGNKFAQDLNQIFIAIGGEKGLSNIMERRGLGKQAQGYIDGIAAARRKTPDVWTSSVAKAVLTEEVFAHISEQMKDRPRLRDRFMNLVGLVRAWLRDHGFLRLSALGESDLLFMLSNARKTMTTPGYQIERSRVVVSGPDLIDQTGRRIDPNHPDFEAALRLADLLGLRQEPGVAVFAARRLRDGLRSINDAVVPETEEYTDSVTGDLAFFPGSKKIEGLPIRIVVGSAKGKHSGFGILHVQDNIARDSRRAPQERTGDMAEDIVREVVRILKSSTIAHQEEDRIILHSPSLKKAVVLEKREHRGERFYSVVTERPAEKNIWGRPDWIGRLTFPIRESTADSPPTAQSRQTIETPRSDRNGLGATSEHLDINQQDAQKQPVVTVKKKKKFERGPTMFRASSVPGNMQDYLGSGDINRSIRDRIGGVFQSLSIGKSARTFNWWHRTIGSQYHKAKISPEFKRVYDAAHKFVDDVSRFANEAADHAKNILPHLDSWKDMADGVRRAFADSGDYKAIASAIFQGTLANGTTGTVWSDQELVDKFGLNQKQIGLYREFRAAVDSSLETLAKSELARAAKAAKLVLASPNLSLDESLRFYLEQEGADSVAESFREKIDQIRKLQSEGYAPLMRFGQYTVDVVRKDESGNPVLDESGEPDRPFFGMFESQAEAIEAEKILQQEYPEHSVSRGILSEETSRLYKGITPETAELFARMLDVDSHEAFQTYLKQAVANRSAMKRLINRKGMDGFANDVPRVLSAFITSTARLSSGNWHMGDMAKAVNEIPDSMGDVKDHAIKLLDYIQNPKDEASWLRGLLFFNFLGGSVAAALVNTTQTFTTTLPYLSQFGARTASSAITKAMGVAGKAMTKGLDAVKDTELREALAKAAEEGVVDPQEIHLLMAEAGGNGASNLVGRVAGAMNKEWATPATRVTRSFTQAWGNFFSMAEKYNRHVAFMASWDVAGEMSNEELEAAGASSRYEFAKNAVIETQFDYTKVSRPNWARGAVGATLFTFKTFMVNYLEFLARLPTRERAIAIAVLMLFSGLSGAPGLDDMEDIIDTIGQKFGYNWNSSAKRHAWLMKTLGEGGANFVEHGISSLIPIDVSARLGMGNLIPGTEVFKKSSTDKGRVASELFGPAGNLVSGVTKVFDDLGSGKDFTKLVEPIAPKAFNDVMKAIDMLQTGYYRDTKGRKVVEANAVDALFKAIGFQPNAVAEPRRVQWMIGQSSEMHRAIRADIYALWATGIFEHDQDKVLAAKRQLTDWNKKNPETPIRLNPDSLGQRVKAMRSSSASRMVKATSREMRGMVRDAIAVGE